MNREDIALVALTALEGAHAYSAFLPSMFTIRTFASQDYETTKRDIRQGEAIATGFTVALGFVVATLMDSQAPVWAALLVAGAMISVYEYALATAH